jgi:hypothetical protein
MKKSSTQLTPQDIDTHKVRDFIYGFLMLLNNHNSDFWDAFKDSCHCVEHEMAELRRIRLKRDSIYSSPRIIIEWASKMDNENLLAFADGMVSYFYGMNPQLLAHLPIKDSSEVKS